MLTMCRAPLKTLHVFTQDSYPQLPSLLFSAHSLYSSDSTRTQNSVILLAFHSPSFPPLTQVPTFLTIHGSYHFPSSSFLSHNLPSRIATDKPHSSLPSPCQHLTDCSELETRIAPPQMSSF